MIPPITAAIRTPNAPTPPLASGAGGFENDDPEGFAVEDGAVDLAEVLEPEAVDAEPPGPGFAVRDAAEVEEEADGDGLPVPVGAEAPALEVLAAEDGPVEDADAAEEAAVPVPDFPAVEAVAPAAPGFAPVVFELSGFVSAGFVPADAAAPVLGTPEVDDPVPVLPDFSFTFSALRSIVTGRFAPAPEPVDGLSPVPGLSAEPDPLPPDEDAPPEDLLSVAIRSPPEPSGHTIHT
ncbi:MAG: hypothetical protein RDA78_09275 [Roseibium sp.]|uniref:hypothetical protein n=1 Tax=Roseibium sp. TaxID=1936156 RepID=UPI003D9C4620